MASNACWGIEIGGGAIKALKLELDGDGVKVADFAVVNHPKVLSTPELDQDDAIRVAMGTLLSQFDLTDAPVAISIPGHQSFARFAKLPPVEPKKVGSVVEFEAGQQIPFPLDEVEWDYQTFVSPDSPEVEVGIFAVTRQRIAERLAMLNDLGLTPAVATISPVAAYNAMAADLEFTEDTPGTIIVDVGTMATDLVIAEAGRVWVRTFPIGGHQFTEAVASQFKLTYSKADKLKREAEQTKYARHVFQAMRPIFSDLAQEIQRSIGFYESVHDDADLKRLIGLGSTFKLPGLRKYLKQQLGLDVYRMEQYKKLSVDGPRAGEFQAASLNLATAYGLALQGLDQATLRANLMPTQILRDAMWRKKIPVFGAAAGIAAVAAGAMFIRPILDKTAFDSADRPSVIQTVTSRASQLKGEADEAMVTSGADDDLRAARIVRLLDDRALYAKVLEDTGYALAAANAAAAQDPEISPAQRTPTAFEVVSFDANWVEAGAAEEEQDFGGGRNSRDPWSAGGSDKYDEDEEATADDSLSVLEDSPHVRVQMVMNTRLDKRQADLLVQRSAETWLRENAEQDGYSIVLARQPYTWTDGPAAASGNQRNTSGFRATGGVQDPRLVTRDPIAPQTGGIRTGGIRGGTSAAGGAQTYSASDLAGLAPLTELEASLEPIQGSVTLTYYIVPGATSASEGDE